MTATLALALGLLAAPQASPAVAVPVVEYVDAKRLADADEKTLVGPAHEAMRAAQARLLNAGVVECSLGKPQKDFTAFTIVMRLDAAGQVRDTWRQGSSPLAICLQRYVRGKTVFTPPRDGFHMSLEISFTK
ncbi:hypothetical protein [Thermomonas mangrovi]|uniref:hypothetical protein n=1 Tax=Thermomonas mangrovi TaxID=2993316 RepID=UPI002306FF47|nr:hypothetical protein [Thermomonas mangrovi]